MMYMVVFKCTRAEREGRIQVGERLPLDCYMVANKMFETVAEAQGYAEAMPLSRQARVVDVIQFRCPITGEWKPGPREIDTGLWTEPEKGEFVEDLIACVGQELDVDTGMLNTGQMRNIVNRVRFWIGEYRTRREKDEQD